MRTKLTLILILSFFSIELFAQISNGGSPRSFEISAISNVINIKDYASPYDENIIVEDDDDKMHFRIGISIPSSINLLKDGTWTKTADGGNICRLKIKSGNALALGLYYNNFLLPPGSDLYIYSEDKKQVIGSFNENNNPSDRVFATELIHGDCLILEYYEPENVSFSATIKISELSYIYRGYKDPYLKSTDNFGNSDYCEVNVNCVPEGNEWQDEKRGVAKILLKVGSSYFWCSGSLVNNVRQDFEPYFLTADHCGHNASTADYLQWLFYFNFETTTCTNPATSPSSNTVVGCTKISEGGNSGSNGSDFKLLLFNSSVPLSYNAYYNGWNRNNIVGSSGVGIHHPAGDVKKISTYNLSSNLDSVSWSGSYFAHWLVYWASTLNGHGVTEGGSSGSPLFNSNGQIIGTLTGGGSYCTATSNPDLYGRFSYSWESNGSLATDHLKEWLDPDNLGTSILGGTNHVISISGLSSSYCLNDLADTISGIPSTGTFSGPGMSGNVFTPTIAGVGTHTITYTTTAGSATQQVTISDAPAVNLGPDIELITGQNIDLDAGFGYSSYLWSDGSSNQLLNVSLAGVYFVEVTNLQGCVGHDTIAVTEIQGANPGWNYINTSINHSILLQDTTPILINGVQIEVGDYIGAFYDSTGTLACGGYMMWTGSSEVLTAWGSQVGLYDGFVANEEFNFKIWDASEDIEYDAIATYLQSGFSNQQYYVTNGMSGIESLTTTISEAQSITINQGWSIFSTYINPLELSMDSIFAPIISNVILIKDGNGQVYWPPYINMIGNIAIGEGYQINLYNTSILDVVGTSVVPESTIINIPSGWSIIGYLRQTPGDAELMLATISSQVIIVKDGNGQVYWPPYINMIGNLIPGQGYQINLYNAVNLTYPSN